MEGREVSGVDVAAAMDPDAAERCLVGRNDSNEGSPVANAPVKLREGLAGERGALPRPEDRGVELRLAGERCRAEGIHAPMTPM